MDSHLEPAPAGSCRAEYGAVRARIIAAADDARRRLERDLHDGLQQRLLCLGLKVRLAEASIPHGHEELKCELARIEEGLWEAMEDVRQISRGSIPPSFPMRPGPAGESPGPPLARPGEAARGYRWPTARAGRDRRLLHNL